MALNSVALQQRHYGNGEAQSVLVSNEYCMAVSLALNGAAFFIILHRVNCKIFLITLCSFEPIVIAFSILRIVVAVFYKDYAAVGDMRLWLKNLLIGFYVLIGGVAGLSLDAMLISGRVK